MKSALEIGGLQIVCYRRAVVSHLVRQSGGPTPDPRDALRLAATHYGLLPRAAALGRFTARICRLSRDDWALDFNPEIPKCELVTAIWHELSELLCLSDDIVSFDGFNAGVYQESAVSPYDCRHLCALGVERYVWKKLRDFPEVKSRLTADKVRRILLVRNTTVLAEPILPAIVREPWFDDELSPEGQSFPM